MNLIQMRTRVREDLQDTDAANYRWSNPEIDNAIQRVVDEYSLVAGIEQQTDIPTTYGSTELNIAGLTGLIKIVSVEFPLGGNPKWLQKFEHWAGKLYMGDAGNGQNARVRWLKRHSLLGTTPWAANTYYSLGSIVISTPNNGLWYECTTAGTSGATQPTWPTTEGATVTDGTVVWTCRRPTIPPEHDEIIVLGATGYLAMSASASTVDRAFISGRYGTISYRGWGKERLARYDQMLKQIAHARRVIQRELYTDE